ncbi:hypothetical protein PENANT_c006G04225 [Penicillium antarcticum]|uniref:Uncharacterized protein n=1 Tax=Penicillium antarcticum TaxID=416450 RepID=A0A1V6QD11_9EURO|nr:uncharacterized protein N7508_009483 [Penicillium antarcticum]KAJ5294662.1 hypothetical protein N7508_009483 [Penicillium antarcticum]OQD87098.1 hypothetical protein PENANT_c006G04225 [Penicillium antarcticum]
MGLIKTGLALAGTYGLIKAASKAANDHEDKKLKRNNQAQQYNGHNYQMNDGLAMNSPGYHQGHGYGVARDLPFDGNSQHLNQAPQSRGYELQHNHGRVISASPPSYYQGNHHDVQRNGGSGPAQYSQQYYPSDSKR